MLLVDEETITVDPIAGNHDKFAHWVLKKDLGSDGAVRAICGKIWNPKSFPDDYPVCPMCDEIYKKLKGSK